MTMVIPRAPSGRLSALFWRRPSLGLFLLLLGPLMWFGIVYLGSLLTLLWQSVYTFDDFTMSVTTDLTLANLKALFNPANYDIIVRTLVMALSVTLVVAAATATGRGGSAVATERIDTTSGGVPIAVAGSFGTAAAASSRVSSAIATSGSSSPGRTRFGYRSRSVTGRSSPWL